MLEEGWAEEGGGLLRDEGLDAEFEERDFCGGGGWAGEDRWVGWVRDIEGVEDTGDHSVLHERV